MDFGILTVFWYFGPLQFQNENASILILKSAPREDVIYRVTHAGVSAVSDVKGNAVSAVKCVRRGITVQRASSPDG